MNPIVLPVNPEDDCCDDTCCDGSGGSCCG